jgi:hypothetical protein
MRLAHVETSSDLAHVTACPFVLPGSQPAGFAAARKQAPEIPVLREGSSA